MNANDWPDFSKALTVTETRAFRRRLNQVSHKEREQVWCAIRDASPANRELAVGQITAVRKLMRAIERQVPSGAWYLNATKDTTVLLGEAVRPIEWPPRGNPKTRMKRARGEKRHYPMTYLTTSGHSWDVYLQKLYARRVQHLLPDGYMGGIVMVYELPASQRSHFRRHANGRAGASNVDTFTTARSER